MFVYDLASGDFTIRLPPQPFQNVMISQWSPNGDWIAFHRHPPPIGDELGTQNSLYGSVLDGSGLATSTSPDKYGVPPLRGFLSRKKRGR